MSVYDNRYRKLCQNKRKGALQSKAYFQRVSDKEREEANKHSQVTAKMTRENSCLWLVILYVSDVFKNAHKPSLSMKSITGEKQATKFLTSKLSG